MSSNTVRLNNAFVPTAYDLTVKVQLSEWTYQAEEKVTLKRNEAFSGDAVVDGLTVIQLHCAPSVEIVSVKGAKLLKRDDALDTLHLALDADASAADHTLFFEFNHGIQEELRGFYRVKYTVDGVEKRMASTHFEPVAARRFYICQDEPAARADFTLHVSVPSADSDITVLSGGKLENKTVEGDHTTWHFLTVPRVPPYLTACVVGHLESTSRVVNGIPLSVYAVPGKLASGPSTLDICAFALDFFENFFRCKFPLPKLDIVAVPDFPIGGMENWGCICCIESILVDEKTAGLEALKRASDLLCHEISHNWFGNLVGIDWWEGLWLKEGFATWCGYYATHMRTPEWNALRGAARDVDGAMVVDSHRHSHPVEVPISDPADITQVFDSISYDKGMALVFMLQHYLGEGLWEKSVAHYIDLYKYKNTKTVQLWEALEEASGLPIKEAMQSFTTQMGYPIISVNRKSDTVIELRQEPCALKTHESSAAHSAAAPVWCVPMSLKGSTGEERMTVTLRGTETQTVNLSEELAKSAVINANPGRAGFFRCRYDDASFAKWLAAYDTFPLEDRTALIADTFAALKVGYPDLSRIAALVPVVLSKETDTSVIEVYVAEVSRLAQCFSDDGTRKVIYQKALSSFIDLGVGMLSVEATSVNERQRKSLLISTAQLAVQNIFSPEECASHPIIVWGIEQAASYLADKPTYTDLLSSSLACSAKFSPEFEAFTEALWKRLQTNTMEDVNARAALHAVCISKNIELAKSVVRHCIKGDRVRGHFGGTVFMAISRNKNLRSGEVWEFFKAEFAGIDAQWGKGQFRIQLIVDVVGSTLDTEEQASEFESFFVSHPLPNARLAIGRAVEGIRLRAFLNAHYDSAAMTAFSSI